MSRELRLQLSLAFNLLLVVTVLALVLHKSGRAPAPIVPETGAEVITAKHPVVIEQLKLPHYPGIASETDRRRWLVDQLRAAGVPNNVVARMVLAELDEGSQKRFDEAALDSRVNPDALAALHLEQEKDTEEQMRAALGEAGFKQWDQARLLREANIGKILLTGYFSGFTYRFEEKNCSNAIEISNRRGLLGDMLMMPRSTMQPTRRIPYSTSR